MNLAMRLVLVFAFAFACGGRAEEPAGATITVGGTPYVLSSAVAHGSHLALSTAAMDCGQVPGDAQIMLARSDLGWTLGGSQLSQVHSAHDDAMNVTLERSRDRLTLSGGGTIAGIKLELAGTIAVLDCK